MNRDKKQKYERIQEIDLSILENEFIQVQTQMLKTVQNFVLIPPLKKLVSQEQEKEQQSIYNVLEIVSLCTKNILRDQIQIEKYRIAFANMNESIGNSQVNVSRDFSYLQVQKNNTTLKEDIPNCLQKIKKAISSEELLQGIYELAKFLKN